VQLARGEHGLDVGMARRRRGAYRAQELLHPVPRARRPRESNQDGSLQVLVGGQPLLDVAIGSQSDVEAIALG
jgi:DNA-binding cell septation regulator SpoVG